MFKKSNLKYISISLMLVILFLSSVSASVISYGANNDYFGCSINNTCSSNGMTPIKFIGGNSCLFVQVGEEFRLSGNLIIYDHSYLEELIVPVPMIYPPIHVFKAKKAGDTVVLIKTITIDGFTKFNKVHIHIQPEHILS